VYVLSHEARGGSDLLLSLETTVRSRVIPSTTPWTGSCTLASERTDSGEQRVRRNVDEGLKDETTPSPLLEPVGLSLSLGKERRKIL
jgi:hypothetical protein